MKNVFKNILCIVLVFALMAVGAALPLLLLEKQEKDLVGKASFYMYEANSENSNIEIPEKPHYNDYIKMAASKNYGNVVLIEPKSEELQMEQAINRAREEIQKLMNANIIPKCDISEGSALTEIRYENYEFMKGEKTRHGFWNMKFRGDGHEIVILMDASYGTITSIQFIALSEINIQKVSGINTKSVTTEFAEYLGLRDNIEHSFSDDITNALVFENQYIILSVYREQSVLTINLEATSMGMDYAVYLFTAAEAAEKTNNEAEI